MLLKAVKPIQNRTYPIKMILLSFPEIITWLHVFLTCLVFILTCADEHNIPEPMLIKLPKI